MTSIPENLLVERQQATITPFHHIIRHGFAVVAMSILCN